MQEEQRLAQLHSALSQRLDTCCSEGTLHSIPQLLTHPYFMDYVTIIVCHTGYIRLLANGSPYTVNGGETAFVSENVLLQILSVSDSLEYSLLCYRIAPIRHILGNTVVMMRIYDIQNTLPLHIVPTEEDNVFTPYISLIQSSPQTTLSAYRDNERQLLLVSLTYRLCDFFSSHIPDRPEIPARTTEIFGKLVSLIGQHFQNERKVTFYADKLCLSPKYLTALVKSVSGYTVQQLIFKAIIRRSIFLINSTSKTIQEIADDLSFPNASAFGTFFKKQTGHSPKHYRRKVLANV